MDYNADNLNWINWVPGGVCVIDPSYQIVAWNDLLEDWTGLKSDDAIGLNLLEMYPHLTSPAFFERLQQVFSTGSPAVYSAGLHRHFLPVQVENAGTTTNMIQQTYVRRVGADRNCVLIYIEDHTRQFSQLKSLHGEMGRRREVENELREHYALQQLITNMQSEYLTTHNSHAFFKSIIERITTFTNSRMGFIAEVVDNKEGRRELAVRACSDQSDCEQTRQFLARYENQKVTFQGYETLFGRIIDEKSSVTAQMPESMPRQGRMPSGHPAIQNFIGLPLIYNQEVIGVVGLANAEEKYPRELEEQLAPFLMSCAHMVHAHSLEKERQRVQEALQKHAKELEDAYQLAQQAVRSKAEFLANMSHEIRTPMTAILGFSEVLNEKGLDETTSSMAIDSIRRNSEHLLVIINDILDISKIEAGRLEIHQEPYSPAALALEVKQMMTHRAEHVALRVDVSANVSPLVMGDVIRIRQILVNLVGNALKFTRDGYVSIRVDQRAVPDGNEIIYSVEDTGIGISPQKLREIFAAFSQADNSITRRFGGSGLGLTISQRLATMMGGEIQVESTPDVGSTFTAIVKGEKVNTQTLNAELRTRNQNETPVLEFESDNPPRILVVEDCEDNRRLIGYLLKKMGVDCDEAIHGKDGIRKIGEAIRKGEPYPLVLMDIQMPEMDGMTAISRLRLSGDSSKIIALTANAMPEDRERFLQAGFNDYIAKPINQSQLRTVINKALKAYRKGESTDAQKSLAETTAK